MPSYKHKQRPTWYCSFYFIDWQGRRKKKKKEGFKTKRAAQDWERRFLEQYANVPNISFAVLVKCYNKYHQENTRPNTHYAKNSIINNHILPHFAQFTIDKITRQHIMDWKRLLMEKNLQPLYARQIYLVLKSIFSFAMDHYNLPSSPCPHRESFGRPGKKIAYWTLEEFHQFALTLTKPHHIMAFYLLFWTGLRSGELLALTWDDIDFESSALSVNRSFSRLRKENIITTGKTAASQRVVIMPGFLATMLKDYQRFPAKDEKRLFPFTKNMLNFALKKGAAKANIKIIRLHDLRHSHASLLINAGFQPIDVADRLGHANAGITLSVYSHFYDSKRVSLAEKLNTIRLL